MPVRVAQPTLRSALGGRFTIIVSARSRPGAKCLAVVAVDRRSTDLMTLRADRAGRTAWRWLILPTSPSGTWRIVVSCVSGHARGSGTTRVLVITRARGSSGAIGEPASIAGVAGEPVGRGGGVCGPFPPGQCTCLAYQKRPDVYNTAVAHGVPAGGERGLGPEYAVWDGGQWLVNAQRAGIPTGSQPVAGALVVWGVPNTASWGHVAYVEAATSPTHVLVNECNWDWKGDCRTIWENPQSASEPLQGYIYGGPAGNGPGAGGTQPGIGPTVGGSDLDFVKTVNTAGTVEVHWATAASGYQQRGGDFASDFSPADDANGHFQLFGSANGAPELGFIKTINTGGTVEVHWDTLQGSSYKRVGDSTSDFSPADAENGSWQIGPF